MSKRTIYEWREGAHFAVEAQTAGERLEFIKASNEGKLTPKAVVEDARNENSPLHRAFTWDDAKAATTHRIAQARDLINHLIVRVKVESAAKTKPLRAMISVQQKEKPSYVSRSTALSEEDLRRQIVERAWRELMSWRERYSDVSELHRVFQVIDRLAPEKKAA